MPILHRLLVSSFLLLLAVGAFAQEYPVERMYEVAKFTGVNTRDGDFFVAPNACRAAHNVDFGLNLGSITRREGYTQAAALGVGFDSLTGIKGVYLRDGRQYMAFSADIAGQEYGGVYRTGYGDDNIASNTQIWGYWSTQAPTKFEVFQDNLYITNGVQRSIVYNPHTSSAAFLPLMTPGEPLLVPRSFTGRSAANYYQNGEYRYVFQYATRHAVGGVWTDFSLPSRCSREVKVKNGMVMILATPLPLSPTYLTPNDSIKIKVWRTLANPGRIDKGEAYYSMPALEYKTTKEKISDTVFVDSISDQYLINYGLSPLEWDDLIEPCGVDTLDNYTYAYGAPYITDITDSTYTTAKSNVWKYGVLAGIPSTIDTLGVRYITVPVDSSIGAVGDSGRSAQAQDVVSSATTHPWKIHLTIPWLTDTVSNMMFDLYRAHDFGALKETTLTIYTFLRLGGEGSAIFVGGGFAGTVYLWQIDGLVQAHNKDPKYKNSQWKLQWYDTGVLHVIQETRVIDSVYTTPFYFVARIKSENYNYIDSLRYDSLISRSTYRDIAPPRNFSNLVAYDGRLIGTYGSSIYTSRLDSANSWSVFREVKVNEDDGDEITAIWAERDGIKVKKNFSSFFVYIGNEGKPDEITVSNSIGCIAPNSRGRLFDQNVFLSNEGVIAEGEGQFMEGTNTTTLLSAPLINIDDYPMDVRSRAVGIAWKNKYLLSFGDVDTTWVYDRLANAWMSWGFSFGGATLFDEEEELERLPGGTLYFYKPGGKTLYKYGNNGTDAGSNFSMLWRSTPMLVSEEEKQITAMGLWYDDTYDTFDRFQVGVSIDGRTEELVGLANFLNLPDTTRYREQAATVSKTGSYFNISITNPVLYGVGQFKIDKINLFYIPVGRKTRY